MPKLIRKRRNKKQEISVPQVEIPIQPTIRLNTITVKPKQATTKPDLLNLPEYSPFEYNFDQLSSELSDRDFNTQFYEQGKEWWNHPYNLSKTDKSEFYEEAYKYAKNKLSELYPRLVKGDAQASKDLQHITRFYNQAGKQDQLQYDLQTLAMTRPVEEEGEKVNFVQAPSNSKSTEETYYDYKGAPKPEESYATLPGIPQSSYEWGPFSQENEDEAALKAFSEQYPGYNLQWSGNPNIGYTLNTSGQVGFENNPTYFDYQNMGSGHQRLYDPASGKLLKFRGNPLYGYFPGKDQKLGEAVVRGDLSKVRKFSNAGEYTEYFNKLTPEQQQSIIDRYLSGNYEGLGKSAQQYLNQAIDQGNLVFTRNNLRMPFNRAYVDLELRLARDPSEEVVTQYLERQGITKETKGEEYEQLFQQEVKRREQAYEDFKQQFKHSGDFQIADAGGYNNDDTIRRKYYDSTYYFGKDTANSGQMAVKNANAQLAAMAGIAGTAIASMAATNPAFWSTIGKGVKTIGKGVKWFANQTPWIAGTIAANKGLDYAAGNHEARVQLIDAKGQKREQTVILDGNGNLVGDLFSYKTNDFTPVKAQTSEGKDIEKSSDFANNGWVRGFTNGLGMVGGNFTGNIAKYGASKVFPRIAFNRTLPNILATATKESAVTIPGFTLSQGLHEIDKYNDFYNNSGAFTRGFLDIAPFILTGTVADKGLDIAANKMIKNDLETSVKAYLNKTGAPKTQFNFYSNPSTWDFKHNLFSYTPRILGTYTAKNALINSPAAAILGTSNWLNDNGYGSYLNNNPLFLPAALAVTNKIGPTVFNKGTKTIENTIDLFKHSFKPEESALMGIPKALSRMFNPKTIFSSIRFINNGDMNQLRNSNYFPKNGLVDSQGNINPRTGIVEFGYNPKIGAKTNIGWNQSSNTADIGDLNSLNSHPEQFLAIPDGQPITPGSPLIKRNYTSIYDMVHKAGVNHSRDSFRVSPKVFRLPGYGYITNSSKVSPEIIARLEPLQAMNARGFPQTFIQQDGIMDTGASAQNKHNKNTLGINVGGHQLRLFRDPQTGKTYTLQQDLYKYTNSDLFTKYGGGYLASLARALDPAASDIPIIVQNGYKEFQAGDINKFLKPIKSEKDGMMVPLLEAGKQKLSDDFSNWYHTVMSHIPFTSIQDKHKSQIRPSKAFSDYRNRSGRAFYMYNPNYQARMATNLALLNTTKGFPGTKAKVLQSSQNPINTPLANPRIKQLVDMSIDDFNKEPKDFNWNLANLIRNNKTYITTHF